MADANELLDSYYQKEHPFREGLQFLRSLALQTELQETMKWNSPVYTIDNKNVLGIMAFKSYFGLWFFHGVFLKDPEKVLENAQDGKTKAMRHWKFTSLKEIDPIKVMAYMNEAVENQKKGIQLKPEKSKQTVIPPILKDAISQNSELDVAFKAFTPYKQREFCEYITSAKQEKTKQSRLQKIIPLIEKGIGLNDRYRKS
ncbi:MAG: hypothetical protein HKN52_07520 [Eudoraea sp.]|nr:YdeI/OmpD-associated family protein [Muriicola sp.]NNE02998.1 hypothetical protein [Eudoraea sp.]